MRKINLTLILFIFMINMNAQTINITGTILQSETNEKLEYATIILNPKSKDKITGGVTNPNGQFNIEIKPGTYDIVIEYLSLETKTILNQDLTKDTNLGIIKLNPTAEALDEVEIIAEKSTVEIRLDKKIYNVGKDMTVKGGTASDVLDNVPSVNVDAEGAVSLRGNENVRILIDGKPSALVGLTGTDALRNLPAEAIEKVEVITSPSARYDAEGTAGILNIVLRKGKITGFNGSVNLTVGKPDMVRISPNLNYRTKKINLFSNFGYSYRKGPGNSNTLFTNFENDIIEGYVEEDRVFDRKNNNFNGSIGLEYYLTKNSSITGSYFYRDSNGDDVATNISDSLDINRNSFYREIRIENEGEDGLDNQYSLNYTNNFDGNGKKLIVDLQYSDSDEKENSPIWVDGVLKELNSQITTSKDKLFQIDYILPIGENSQVELGHKTTLQDLFSDFKVRDASGNPFEFDTSNAIDFKQNIYAFYAQYGNKIDKFSYLLGLRTEITDIDLKVLTTSELSDKNYTEWFPTVNLGYEVNDDDSFTLGFSRRLRRPRHWFLNPFESRSSARNIFKGNPDINPTFSSSFDLGYTTRVNKLTLNSSIYFQHSTDIMQPLSFSEERTQDGITFPVFVRTPVNLGTENRYGFELTTNYNPTKKVRLSATFNYFKFNTDAFVYDYTNANGINNSISLDEVNESSWFARFNSRITLPAKIQWQTRLMFRGPQKNAQSDRSGMFVANLAFSKDIFKEKASLVLNASDLLNSRKRENTTYYGDRQNPSSIAVGEFQWRERQITLSLTYRFNQKKKREQPERNFDGGGEDFGG
jgi:outer membrane receptor protein involved in Fe transport